MHSASPTFFFFLHYTVLVAYPIHMWEKLFIYPPLTMFCGKCTGIKCIKDLEIGQGFFFEIASILQGELEENII